MNTISTRRIKVPLPIVVFLSTLLTLPLLNSCGGGSRNAGSSAPVNDTVGRPVNDPGQPQQKKGLSTGQKVGITLVGAAALYYLYRQHQNAQKQGAQGKYYLSKNGRVYYRDAQGKPHWVEAPSGGIQVPQSQAQQYQDFQGYDRRTTGRDLSGVAPAGAQ